MPSINMVVVTLVGAQWADGGKHHSAARRVFWSEERQRSAHAVGGQRQPRGKSGFRAGDVIVKVNDQPVHDTSDFPHAVRSRNGDSVSVGVMRDKKEQNLKLPICRRKESGDLWRKRALADEPLIQAESALELSKLQNEIASLRPEMELAAARPAKAAEGSCARSSDASKENSQRQTEKPAGASSEG